MRFIIPLFLLFFITSVTAQEVHKRNLTRPDKMFYDYRKTKLLSTGAYYKDDLGETKIEHGEWKYYSKDQKLEEIRNYYKGKIHGLVMLYWPNGNKKQEGYFILDSQDSVYREWSENGILLLEGYYSKGQKTDQWKSFYLDGKPKMVEEYRDSIRYVQSFWTAKEKQTVIDGNGQMVYRFYDNRPKEVYHFKNGLEDGAFIEYNINGNEAVTGFYQEGLKTGEWRQYFYNGKIEKIANYKANQLDGPFEQYYDNGQLRVSGSYIKGLKNNRWTWYAINGTLDMKGSFLDDLQDGDWTYYYPDGKVSYTAQFQKDKKHGTWNYFYRDGSKFKIGNFKDDEKNGNWKTWYENGKLLMDGNYVAGKEEGVWLNYWDNGVLKNEATFKNGKLHGAWVSYNQSGKKTLEGTYKDGLKNKTWIEYFDKGALKTVETYKVKKIKSKVNYGPMKKRVHYVSVKEGPYVSYSLKDFKKTEEGNYKNDKKDGVWLAYYPGGRVVAVLSNYKEGKLSGYMRQFDQRGNILNETQFKEGVKHGTMKIFDKRGKVIKQKDFEFGEEKRHSMIPKR